MANLRAGRSKIGSAHTLVAGRHHAPFGRFAGPVLYLERLITSLLDLVLWGAFAASAASAAFRHGMRSALSLPCNGIEAAH